jgi:hypothetical protein
VHAQSESDLLHAHRYANQLALQRAEAAKNLQNYIDERIQDEQFYLELEQKKCESEIVERDLAKERVMAKKRYLTEVESRITAEKQAALVSNQRQIAEQLLRQAALATWQNEKQLVKSIKPAAYQVSMS